MATRGVSGIQIDGKILCFYLKSAGPIDHVVKVISDENGWDRFKENARKIELVRPDGTLDDVTVDHYIDNYPDNVYPNGVTDEETHLENWNKTSWMSWVEDKKKSGESRKWEEFFGMDRRIGGWGFGLIFVGIYNGTVRHIVDGSDFFENETYCEECNIINLDDMTYDIYEHEGKLLVKIPLIGFEMFTEGDPTGRGHY